MLPVSFGRGHRTKTSKNIPLSCIINIFIIWKMGVRLYLPFSFNVTWQGSILPVSVTHCFSVYSVIPLLQTCGKAVLHHREEQVVIKLATEWTCLCQNHNRGSETHICAYMMACNERARDTMQFSLLLLCIYYLLCTASHWPHTGNIQCISYTHTGSLGMRALLKYQPQNWPVTDSCDRCLSSLLWFISDRLWIFISSNCWLSIFWMNVEFSHVYHTLHHCSCGYPPRNLITSNNLTLQRACPPHRNGEDDLPFFFCFKRNCVSVRISAATQAGENTMLHFDARGSLIIWWGGGAGGNTIDSGLFCFFCVFFFCFSSLGNAPFSPDTHYKVNSNCALGHSGETQGCPQAKALSHTLWC